MEAIEVSENKLMKQSMSKGDYITRRWVKVLIVISKSNQQKQIAI